MYHNSGMSVKSRRNAHTEATRRALLVAGRRLFGARGYAAVSVDAVARHARVTIGALYHHFRDKRDLFRAVYEQVLLELAERIAVASGQHEDPWDQLIAGCDAWLTECRDGEVRQIVLIDAPSVLGWEQWRQLDAPHGFGLTVRGLRSAMNAGVLKHRSPEALAYLLYGALNEAGLALARAEDFEAARAEMRGLISELLTALRTDPDVGDG
jgi:AcrR family transcriptional regulator